ncbi:hypothetical protein [Flavobacterium sp. N2038]|uniref:hypothetical protein n=1 Tax=Flavobacterium sp. N2038 TaxID=2986829 RepID=UPI002225478D|nr:hypothetical protein [Flavobacterium sp. N2038]
MQKKNRPKKYEVRQKSKTTNVNTNNKFSMYGITPEEYKEGIAIHAKCFNQIKKVKPLF